MGGVYWTCKAALEVEHVSQGCHRHAIDGFGSSEVLVDPCAEPSVEHLDVAAETDDLISALSRSDGSDGRGLLPGRTACQDVDVADLRNQTVCQHRYAAEQQPVARCQLERVHPLPHGVPIESQPLIVGDRTARTDVVVGFRFEAGSTGCRGDNTAAGRRSAVRSRAPSGRNGNDRTNGRPPGSSSWCEGGPAGRTLGADSSDGGLT